MSVQNATLAVGATSLSVTGGTSKTFSPTGDDVKNGIRVVDTSATDFRIRKSITVRNRSEALQSDGTYSKFIRKAELCVPKILASGSVVKTWVRVEIEAHPENTVAEVTDLQLLGGQILSDPDFTNFFLYGSVA